jgi:hypothetical protein
MKKGDALTFPSSLTARQMAGRVESVKDDAGYFKVFRCQTSDVGEVTVFCEGSFRISATHTHTTAL